MKYIRGFLDFLKRNFYDNTFVMNFMLMFSSLLFVELIVKLINGYSIISWSSVRIIVGLSIISLILSFAISYLKSYQQKIITCVIAFAFSAYSCIQLGFLKFLGVYASLQSANQAGAVKDYISDFLKSFNPLFLTTFIPFIGLVVIYIFNKRRIYKVNHYRLGFVCAIAVTLLGCGYFELVEQECFQNDLQTVSNHELFLTASNPMLTVSEYGTLGFMLMDARNAAFPIEVKSKVFISAKVKESSGEVIKGIDDSVWQSIIDEETDEELKKLSSYFMNRSKATKNDMTGVFKDKNLIVLMLESVNDIFLEYPEYFPNINRIMNGGWNWENYYSPRNACATLNNEFSGMTSLYSINNTCTAKTYIDNTYFESIFNIFRNSGYYAFSGHDYTEHYYPRSIIHPNMGSERYYGVEDLNIPYDPNNYKNWAYDDDFIKSILNILDGVTDSNDRFMTWLTTVSSHQPYNRDSNQGNKYYGMTEGTGYHTDIRHYMSKLKIVDVALGVLLDGLEKRGILDDTVIVLFGDHYPYGIDTNVLNTVMSYDTNVDMNAEQVPFIIYNSEITEAHPYTYGEYATYVDILPTIANLFDLNYESRLYMGEDLFSENYTSIAIFADGSWKNEDTYFKNSSGGDSVNNYSSFEHTTDELKYINEDIAARLTNSVNAVKYNYFAYLKEKVDEKEKEIEKLRETACLMRDKDLYCNQEETEDNS